MTTCMTCSTPATAATPRSGSRWSSAASASASLVDKPETTSSSRITLGAGARDRGALQRRGRQTRGGLIAHVGHLQELEHLARAIGGLGDVAGPQERAE